MNLLWGVVLILVVLWLLGAFVMNLGSIIHILLVVALVAIVWNLLTDRRGG